MSTRWLNQEEMGAWIRLVAVIEMLPAALDSQLRRDADLTHYEYYVLAMLSEAPRHTLRMSWLASRTNGSLPRLSHVVSRLEKRGLVSRSPCPEDGRATNATLTAAGWEKVVASAPGHLEAVREYVVDRLTPTQLAQLGEIAGTLLDGLDPHGQFRHQSASTAESGV